MQPMINILIVLSHYLFSSFGLAIIALTIVIRACMYPLTVKQLQATKAMQTLQPKLMELQKKYARDRQKLAQEQMRLYRESGVSPAGCMVPMLIQMPIWIALFYSIRKLLAITPEDFLGLSQYLYSWPIVYSALPLGNQFLWLNLAEGDLVLAILVGGTMWLQQKMVTPVSADPRQQTQSRMMLWMMPLMFTFLSLSFPSGLALYWVVSNVISIVMQYFATGWGALAPALATKQVTRDKKYKKRIAEVEQAPSAGTAVSADIVEPSTTQEEGTTYGESGDKRKDSRGGYPTSLRAIRRQPRRGRGHHPKRG
jgi:YidC/Oxa1 family membrane protein insertase